MRSPRWLRRAKRPHVSELVGLTVTVGDGAGLALVSASLETLALATKYGGGVYDFGLPPLATPDGRLVEIELRYRDTPGR